MIDDLRHLPREEDPFVLLTEGECAVLIACCLALGYILSTIKG